MDKKRWIIALVCLAFITVAILLSGKEKTLTISTEHPSLATTLPVIIVDAGHGGIDGGTSGADGTLEKDINLQIALKTQRFLQAFGFQTIMTREEDRLLCGDEPTIRQKKRADLNYRLSLVQQQDSCVLLSIHQNYFQSTEYYGSQVFYSANNAQSELLAQTIQNRIVTNLQPDNTRTIRSVGSEIYLLHQSNCPAIMVECGFMSNLKELTQLKNETYQTHLAYTIAMGLLDYYTQ